MRCGLTILLGLLAVGCGSKLPPPTTYEVKGTVVIKDGAKPLTAGTIEFIHQTDPTFNARSEIDPEGQFALYTFHGNTKLTGAGAGDYRVTISLPQGSDQIAHTTTLAKLYKVEEQDNFFPIVLDKMP